MIGTKIVHIAAEVPLVKCDGCGKADAIEFKTDRARDWDGEAYRLVSYSERPIAEYPESWIHVGAAKHSDSGAAPYLAWGVVCPECAEPVIASIRNATRLRE